MAFYSQIKKEPWFFTACLSLFFGSAISLILFVFLKNIPFSGGVLFGCVFGVVNFVFLSKIIVNFLSGHYKASRASRVVLVFILKFAVMLIPLWLAFGVFDTKPLGFLIGYATLFIGFLGAMLFGRGNAFVKKV